jgi:hypothetical protein
LELTIRALLIVSLIARLAQRSTGLGIQGTRIKSATKQALKVVELSAAGGQSTMM